MKIAAKVSTGDLARGLARLQTEIEASAIDAAADVLAAELSETREREVLYAPLLRGVAASGRFVGANDAESVAREFGTLDQPPAPWLAPSLPRARARMRREAAAHAGNAGAPMRAAVMQAVARALSRIRR